LVEKFISAKIQNNRFDRQRINIKFIFAVFNKKHQWIIFLIKFELLKRRSAASKIAPIGAVSFLWNKVEQKDLAESGT